jgi:transcription elongation factor Elf1
VHHAQQRLLATIKRTAIADDASWQARPKIARRVDKRTDRQLNCSKCNFRCESGDVYRRHVDMHGGTAPISCTMCDYRAAHTNIVRFHEQNHHIDVPVSMIYKQAVMCKASSYSRVCYYYYESSRMHNLLLF